LVLFPVFDPLAGSHSLLAIFGNIITVFVSSSLKRKQL
jgi:hypothetical protein